MGSLPPDNTRRWVARRKAAVVAAVKCGELTLEQACRRYQLSEEEFRSWESAYDLHGLAGLRVTRRARGFSRSRLASPKQPTARRAQPSSVF
jgi:transposase-like protein